MSDLSILIRTCNSQQHIKQSLDSVIQLGHDIIVVDDASSDDTLSILKNYPVKLLINRYNEGEAICRNRGILAAKTEFIAIQGDCDISAPDRFDRQMQLMSTVRLVGCHVAKINVSHNIVGYISYPPSSTVDIYACILQGCSEPVLEQTMLFHRQTIIDVGGFNSTHLLSGFDLVCRMLTAGISVSNIEHPLVFSFGKLLTKQQRYDLDEDSVNIRSQFLSRSYPRLVLDPTYFEQDSFAECATII